MLKQFWTSSFDLSRVCNFCTMGRDVDWAVQDDAQLRQWLVDGRKPREMRALRPDWSLESINTKIKRLRRGAPDQPRPLERRRTTEVVAEIETAATETPRQTLSMLRRHSSLDMSRATLWRALHEDLQGRCFKPVRAPRLTAENRLPRLNFCRDVLQRVGALGPHARGVLRREVLPLELHQIEPRTVRRRVLATLHGGPWHRHVELVVAGKQRSIAHQPAHHDVFERARNPAPHVASVLARLEPTRFSPLARLRQRLATVNSRPSSDCAPWSCAQCQLSTQKPLKRRAPLGSFTDAWRACAPEAAFSSTACDGPAHVHAFVCGLLQLVLEHGPKSLTIGQVFSRVLNLQAP